MDGGALCGRAFVYAILRSTDHFRIHLVDLHGGHATVPRATVGSVQRRGGDQRDVDTGGGLVDELYRWFHKDNPWLKQYKLYIYVIR